MLIGMVFMIIWEMFHGRISLNSVLLLLLLNLWVVQVGVDVYIPHQKYQVKPHSFQWFSATYPVAIVHRNHFFFLYQQNKSFESKVKFRQAGNCCKRVLKLPNLHRLTKQESITFQKIGSLDFWEIANSVLNKGKSAIPPLLNSPEVLSSASGKAKLFAENFSKNSNLDNSDIFLTDFPSRTTLKQHNISVIPNSKELWAWNFFLTSWTFQ